jgi:DNA-binding PadR family transcriptional regulator
MNLISKEALCRFAGMPRLTLQTQAILAVLLSDAAQPHYGLEMAQAAGLASGTIYPILVRLERAGWVQSTLEDIDPKLAGRRARRYYTLTAEGEQVARAEIAATLNDLGAAPNPPAKRPVKPLPLPGAFPA